MRDNSKTNNFVRVSSENSKINTHVHQQSKHKNTVMTFQPHEQDHIIDLKEKIGRNYNCFRRPTSLKEKESQMFSEKCL